MLNVTNTHPFVNTLTLLFHAYRGLPHAPIIFDYENKHKLKFRQ